MTEITNIETTLPLSPDIMVEFFKDKERTFLIDYKETKKEMSPKSMLVYLSNLQIKCLFDDIDEDLIVEYLYLKDLCNTEQLNLILCNILYYKKFQTEFYPIEDFEQLFNNLMKDHSEIITHYEQILEASSLYILSQQYPELIENAKHDSEIHPKLGFSFLKLYSTPEFLISYLSEIKPLDEQMYFDKYFDNDEYMFKGQNLFNYFAHEENSFFSLLINVENLKSILSGKEATEEMEDSVKRMVTIYDILQEH